VQRGLGTTGGDVSQEIGGVKSKLLSRGGRLTLLKSSIWSLPIYFMPFFELPMSIARCLEKIMRFSWPNNGSTKGIHGVNWGQVGRLKQ